MATKNQKSGHRRSIRLKGYDYSQPGAYFFTSCALRRMCLFGDLRDNQMQLSRFGVIVQECWRQLPYHYQGVSLDAFIVMPNHVHGIILLGDSSRSGAGESRAGLRPAPTAAPDECSSRRETDAGLSVADVPVMLTSTVGAGLGPAPTSQHVENSSTVRTDCVHAVTAGSTISVETVGAGLRPALPSTANNGPRLFEIIRAFKSFSSRAINEIRRTPGLPVWQRNYFERIIRDEDGLRQARGYILNNPQRWSVDHENPDYLVTSKAANAIL